MKARSRIYRANTCNASAIRPRLLLAKPAPFARSQLHTSPHHRHRQLAQAHSQGCCGRFCFCSWLWAPSLELVSAAEWLQFSKPPCRGSADAAITASLLQAGGSSLTSGTPFPTRRPQVRDSGGEWSSLESTSLTRMVMCRDIRNCHCHGRRCCDRSRRGHGHRDRCQHFSASSHDAAAPHSRQAHPRKGRTLSAAATCRS